jgi:DNA-binding NarL/FixJ family response regulator
MTPHDLLELRIANVITDREYDVQLLRHKGMSQRTISLALGISRSAVRERLDNADRKIRQHQRKDAA